MDETRCFYFGQSKKKKNKKKNWLDKEGVVANIAERH